MYVFCSIKFNIHFSSFSCVNKSLCLFFWIISLYLWQIDRRWCLEPLQLLLESSLVLFWCCGSWRLIHRINQVLFYFDLIFGLKNDFFSAFEMCFFVSVQSFPPSGNIFVTLGHFFVSNLFFNRTLIELVFCKIFIRFILDYKWVLTVLIHWILAILVFIDRWLSIFFIFTFILFVIVILIFLNRVWKVFIFLRGIVPVFPWISAPEDSVWLLNLSSFIVMTWSRADVILFWTSSYKFASIKRMVLNYALPVGQFFLENVEDIFLVAQIHDFTQIHIEHVLLVAKLFSGWTEYQICVQLFLINGILKVFYGNFKKEASETAWALLEVVNEVRVGPVGHLDDCLKH